MSSTTGENAAQLKRRAVLLATWRLTPDDALRTAIECELYGSADTERAAEEAARFASAPD